MNLKANLIDHIPGVLGYRLWKNEQGRENYISNFLNKWIFPIFYEGLRDANIPLFVITFFGDYEYEELIRVGTPLLYFAYGEAARCKGLLLEDKI